MSRNVIIPRQKRLYIYYRGSQMPKMIFTQQTVKAIKTPPPPRQIVFTEKLTRGLSLLLVVSYGGSKSWRVQLYEDGAARTFALGTGSEGQWPKMKVATAKEKAKKFFEDPEGEKAKAETGTFKEIAEEWVKRHVVKKGLRSKPEIERRLNKYVFPQWKQKKFRELRRSDVTKLLDKVEDDHGAPQADRVLADVSSICNWFAARNDDYNSPIVRGMRRTNPSERKRKRKLDDNEIRLFWAACDEMPVYGAMLKVAFLTAQRIGKVKAMEWKHVSDGIWMIETEHREKSNAEGLKLPAMALDIIEAQAKVKGNPYVFPASTGKGHFNSFSQRKDELDALLPEAMPAWTVHDLRRTARSLMSRAGVESSIAERVLGHAVAGVEGTYDRHDYVEEKAEALNKLSKLIEMILNPPEGENVVPLRAASKA